MYLNREIQTLLEYPININKLKLGSENYLLLYQFSQVLVKSLSNNLAVMSSSTGPLNLSSVASPSLLSNFLVSPDLVAVDFVYFHVSYILLVVRRIRKIIFHMINHMKSYFK